MPKITNKFNLPKSIVRAMEKDPYSSGGSDFSVTQLLQPPRAQALLLKYKDEIEEDASNRVWSLLGQAVHVILERSARPQDLIETRFFASFKGFTLSGQIDLFETDSKTLSDYKTTKAWAFSKKGGLGKKPEWISQLNMGALLMSINNIEVQRLQIVGILRDFDAKQASREGYPDREIVTVKLPKWDLDKTTNFVNERIELHVEAREKLPQCTSSETWGGRRCTQWCQVAKFCDQYSKAKKSGLLEEAHEVTA